MTIKIKVEKWIAPKDGIIEKESVLDALDEARIFSVDPTENGEFVFAECCDYFYEATLTKEQVLMLANELRVMVGEPGIMLPIKD